MPRYGVSIARVVPIPEWLYDHLRKMGMKKEAILQWWYTRNIKIIFDVERTEEA